MSSDALPIGLHQFTLALKDLPLTTLHLKAAELRNSLAHLDYSNEQLRPFAESDSSSSNVPDPVCVEAIQENQEVITRMSQRLEALKEEVEGRGASWLEFLSIEEVSRALNEGRGLTEGARVSLDEAPEISSMIQNGDRGSGSNGTSGNPWTDGTFVTGRISDGEVITNRTETRSGVGMNGVHEAVVRDQRHVQNGGINDAEMRRRLDTRPREDVLLEDGDGMYL